MAAVFCKVPECDTLILPTRLFCMRCNAKLPPTMANRLYRLATHGGKNMANDTEYKALAIEAIEIIRNELMRERQERLKVRRRKSEGATP